jgi:hypothetical protein
MNASDIRPVSSKEHELIPTDIFAVAAHEYKEGLESIRDDAKKAGVSPERLAYTIMLKEYSDPQLFRIRAGNTLFTIKPLPGEIGWVRGYNGDTAENYINNLIELVNCADKMGFKFLITHATKTIYKLAKLAADKHGNLKISFDPKNMLLLVTLPEGA